MSSYSRTRDQRIADESSSDYGGSSACIWCGTVTQRSVLSEHGTRCVRCYAEYCRFGEPMRATPVLGRDEKVAILERMRSVVVRLTSEKQPKQWAYDLQRRESEDGIRLSPVQRQMVRAAIGTVATDEQP